MSTRWRIEPKPTEEEIRAAWQSDGRGDFVEVIAGESGAHIRTDKAMPGYENHWETLAYVYQSEISTLQGYYAEGWAAAEAEYQSGPVLFYLRTLISKMEEAEENSDEWYGDKFNLPKKLVSMAVEAIEKQGE
jgi:hypothetical protein